MDNQENWDVQLVRFSAQDLEMVLMESVLVLKRFLSAETIMEMKFFLSNLKLLKGQDQEEIGLETLTAFQELQPRLTLTHLSGKQSERRPDQLLHHSGHGVGDSRDAEEDDQQRQQEADEERHE